MLRIPLPASLVEQAAAYSSGELAPAEPRDAATVVLMRPGAVTHGFNMSQRSVICAITGATGSAVTATAPPDGNVSPPGYHLRFLIDHDRTPSLGRWIRLS